MHKETAIDTTPAQNKYLIDMSRDIRTHVHAVLEMASLILDTSELGEVQRRYVETVRNSSEWLLTLINDFLDFPRGGADKRQVNTIDFDLRTAIESVTGLLLQEARDKGVELASLVHSNVPSFVRGDPWRLRQLLINLTSSALTLTKKGDVVIQSILVDETATHVTIHFAVTDSWEYIAGNELYRLPESSSQVDTATIISESKAACPALTISRQFCELMGSKLVAKGKESEGLTFCLCFNLMLEKQPDAAQALPLRPEYVHGLRVLIVTDKEVNRQVLSHYLNTWGCVYDSAITSEEALKKLRMMAGTPQEFQLALVDVPTPDINAEGLARTIKGDPILQELPLALITSQGKRGDADRMQKAGFVAFMTKPIREAQLFDCVAAVMGFQHKRDKGAMPKLITRHSLKETAQCRRARILLVDDSALCQKIAVSILEKLDYIVDIAANGLEAVKAFKGNMYDLILMDWEMPEMDGVEATKEIRRLEGAERHTPIIALSASLPGGHSNHKIFIKAGMDDYLVKPYQPKDLIAIIRKWLDGEPASDEKITKATEEQRHSVVFDEAEALSHVDGDKALLIKLAQLFLDDDQRLLSKIHHAITTRDSKAIRYAAHALKGSAGNLSAGIVFDAALRLETMGRDGNLSQVEEAYEILKKETERLETALKPLCRQVH